jgi:hypothetical protein
VRKLVATDSVISLAWRSRFGLRFPARDLRIGIAVCITTVGHVRATFYTTGMEHSPTSATGTAWEGTPVARDAAGGVGGVEEGGRRPMKNYMSKEDARSTLSGSEASSQGVS